MTVRSGHREKRQPALCREADRRLPRHIKLGCAVTALERTPHGVVVHDSHDHAATYDHVVIASHSDQALAMLSDADAAERAILGVTGLPRSR